MSDNILSAVLTFSVLAAGTAAIGSEVFGHGHAPTPTTVAVESLPRVTVVGRRIETARVEVLPTIVVSGRRLAPVQVAIESQDESQQRVQ